MKKPSTHELASSTTSKININNNMKKTTTTTTPCCSKVGMKRGPWSVEEDDKLSDYIKKEGEGRWRTLPKRAGLHRCGKSCRLRWMNYLRPNVKRGQISPDEDDLILRLHRLLGNRWSLIAGRIPGRTDNEIKNYWNTHLSKKLIRQGINPRTHKPFEDNKPPSSTKGSSSLVIPPPHHHINSSSNPIFNALEQPCNDHDMISISNPNNIFNALEPSNNNHNSSSNPNTVCALEQSGNDHHNSSSNPNLDQAKVHTSSNHTLFSDHDDHHLTYDYNQINDNQIDFMINNVNDDYSLNHEGCNDDVFSSFLDSLMNEEMFDTTATQNQQQTPGFGAEWDI